MPPRHQTLPPAATSSAREAQKSFYCALCAKGYARMNDYESHLGSYDHAHKQRLRDMKAMVRDPAAVARARKAEAKADGLVTIKVADGSAGGGGFKKGGFKKSGFKNTVTPVVVEGQQQPQQLPTGAKEGGTMTTPVQPEAVVTTTTKPPLETLGDSDTEDEGYEMYDPRYPTD